MEKKATEKRGENKRIKKHDDLVTGIIHKFETSTVICLIKNIAPYLRKNTEYRIQNNYFYS